MCWICTYIEIKFETSLLCNALLHFNFLHLYWNELCNIYAGLMLLYCIVFLSRNTVKVQILNKQMSHAHSEHELKCVQIVYAFMHFEFFLLFLRIDWKFAFRRNKSIMQFFLKHIKLNFEKPSIILYTLILNNFVWTLLYFINIKIKSS